MAFARASVLRKAADFARASRPSVARPLLWRQVARRGYATGHGHESAKASSDLPWAIGAVAVTVPTCWYLLQSSSDSAHDGHGSSHDKSHDEKPKENTNNEAKNDDEGKAADSEGKSDDSDDEGSAVDTPETSDDEGVTKEEIPDAKGGQKKRISSSRGIKQDEADSDSEENAPKDTAEDKPKNSKTPGDESTTSGKQEGLSNTDTKHSTDPQNDSDISNKAEGGPESAKLKGTVDPERPAK